MTFGLYMAQRVSALVMVPFVIVHIAVMIYAVQGGLTAGEILGRTQGSVTWLLFYGLFVLAVSVHAAIGLRNIAAEWGGMRRGLGALTALVCLALLAMGARAVWGVTFGVGT